MLASSDFWSSTLASTSVLSDVEVPRAALFGNGDLQIEAGVQNSCAQTEAGVQDAGAMRRPLFS